MKHTQKRERRQKWGNLETEETMKMETEELLDIQTQIIDSMCNTLPALVPAHGMVCSLQSKTKDWIS